MRDAQKQITENLETWSAAIKRKSAAGRGSKNKLELYGIKKLRELILDLAVRGLLVPQDSKDECASVLLKKIATEKSRLIKTGKIKKQKPLPEIREDEKPFQLPRGWKWVRLQNISEYIQRGKGPKYSDNGSVTVISQKCVQWTGFDLSKARFISDDSLDKYQEERFLKNADLLWNSTGTGTVGRINLIENVLSKTLVADSHVTVIRTFLQSNRFICNYISSNSVQKRIEPIDDNPLVSGTTNQVELNTSAVVNLPTPFPPLSEQHRIVAKVDELMALCDDLQQQQNLSISAHETLVKTLLGALTTASGREGFNLAWSRIEKHFHVLFTTQSSIEQLKQTLLQLAVMGKLVPQNPQDEPASVLLEKIAKEKAQLIKTGKIKKQKKRPKISEDEKPFELPTGWEWCRVGSAGLCSTGKTPSTRNPEYFGGETPFLGPGQISIEGEILESDKKLTTKGCEFSVLGVPGDVLMVCIGGSIGKSAITKSRVAFNQQINCISPIYINHIFLHSAMNAPHFQIEILEVATGSATPIINRAKWEELLIPLPPLKEQHRIVAKINELMALCDSLKTQLNTVQNIQVQLADSLAAQAIG